jgi:hypothetical protein
MAGQQSKAFEDSIHLAPRATSDFKAASHRAGNNTPLCNIASHCILKHKKSLFLTEASLLTVSDPPRAEVENPPASSVISYHYTLRQTLIIIRSEKFARNCFSKHIVQFFTRLTEKGVLKYCLRPADELCKCFRTDRDSCLRVRSCRSLRLSVHNMISA